MKLESILQAAADKLKIDFNLVTAEIKHDLSKGRVREAELVEELLRPHLPGNVAIVQGAEVVCPSGETSNECDIVIYDRNATAFIDKSVYKVIPIEAVYIAIEVKSDLDSKEMTDASQKIQKLKSMKMIACGNLPIGTRSTKVYGQDWNFFPIIGFVFAYKSMSLPSVLSCARGLNDAAERWAGIDGVWVLDKQGAILNWSDERDEILYASDSDGRLSIISGANPLLSMLVTLQMWCLNSWMPKFDLLRYVDPASFGTITDEPSDKTKSRNLAGRVDSAFSALDRSARMGQTSPSMIVEFPPSTRITRQ